MQTFDFTSIWSYSSYYADIHYALLRAAVLNCVICCTLEEMCALKQAREIVSKCVWFDMGTVISKTLRPSSWRYNKTFPKWGLEGWKNIPLVHV